MTVRKYEKVVESMSVHGAWGEKGVSMRMGKVSMCERVGKDNVREMR
jgi:hypothetical protein